MKMRKILAVLACLAMLCTVLPLSAMVSAATVVASYDFEDGTTSWGGTVIEANGGYAIEWAANGYGYLNKKPTLQDNTWYKVTFDHKGDPVNALIWNDTVALAVAQTPTSADWTTYSYIFYSGVHATRHFRFQNPSSSAKTICLDNIKLETLDGTAQYDNYLYDGNFEADAGNWVKLQSGVSVVADPTGAGQGNVLQTNSTAQGDMFRQRFYLDAQTDYVLSFKVYGYASSSELTNSVFYTKFNSKITYDLNAIEHDGLAGVAQASAYNVRCNVNTNTGKWINVSIPFSSNEATATDITIYNYRTIGKFYFDDFKVTKAGEEPSEPETPVEPETPSVDSLIVNGDFETGSKDPWTSGSSSAAITVNTANAHGGSYGAMIPARNRTFTAKQAVTVKANTNYTVTFWYKSTDAAQEIHLLFGVYDASATASNNEPLASQVALDNSKSDWTQVTYVFNSGSNTSVLVAFGSDNSSCLVKDYIYVDDIVMVEGGEVPSEPAGYVGSYPQTMAAGADIRYMTYNVLVGQDTNNGGYSWGQPIGTRPEKAFAMINYYKPDVIAFEEFSGEWYDAFNAQLTDYALGEMTGKDSQNGGKLYTCLAYNKNTITLIETKLFRNTVSRWGTQGMRYVNVAIFEVKATGERFIAAALHPDAGNLDGTQDLNGDGNAAEGDGYWRQFQLKEAGEYLAGLSAEYNLPLIVGGDFNSGLDGTYDDYTSWYNFTDNGFTDATNGRYIDHIMYNGMATHLYETTVADAAVLPASDHKPVFADIQFLDEFATPIKNAKDYIKTQGRTTLKDGALWLDFSASGIEFSAYCEGKVALNLNVKSQKSTDATYGGIYFTVIVDGVKKDRAQCRVLTTGTVELVLAENLPAGNHTFEVYRQTEHRNGEVGISSIVMNGSFNDKPADNRLYIEFIGDSISTGFGVLGTTSDSEGGTALWQDATLAYPYLTAKALGADFSDVCYSGIGAKYGWQDPNMLNFYPYQRWQYDRNTQYNFNARQPDVVVIALGTNDISMESEKGITVEQRLAGYQELLDLVRAKNPNSKIVWIYGMMKDDDNARIPAIIEENGGAAAGLYSLELVTNTAGAGWHPSAAGQQKFADDLVAFLNSDVLVKYVGDEMLDNDEGCVVSYEGSSRMEMTADKLGLAFKFQVLADGVAIKEGCATQVDLTNATIDAFGDGNQYKLIRMGAVVSNNALVGLSDMKLSDVDGKKTIDVGVTYLCDLEADAAQFAVRITNIPVEKEETIIYARAYYVFEYEGREVVVYDDIQSANYVNKYNQNDGVLEW